MGKFKTMLSEAYDEGVDARLKGVGSLLNPYMKRGDEARHVQWEEGWMYADRTLRTGQL